MDCIINTFFKYSVILIIACTMNGLGCKMKSTDRGNLQQEDTKYNIWQLGGDNIKAKQFLKYLYKDFLGIKASAENAYFIRIFVQNCSQQQERNGKAFLIIPFYSEIIRLAYTCSENDYVFKYSNKMLHLKKIFITENDQTETLILYNKHNLLFATFTIEVQDSSLSQVLQEYKIELEENIKLAEFETQHPSGPP